MQLDPKEQEEKSQSQKSKEGNTKKQSEQSKSQDQRGWKWWEKVFEDQLMHVKDDSSFYVHNKTFNYSKMSLGILDNKSKLRVLMVWLIWHPYFENFIIFLIFLNSMFLGIKNYKDTDNVTPINKFIESVEPFFSQVFLIECVTKVLAMGFIMYLSEPWNVLDFLVVVTSVLESLPAMQNMSGLRTFRLFRPLRSLQTMPSMKLLIGTLLSSIKHLTGIMGLAIFFFMIYAILGVSLFDGRIHYRCYRTSEPNADGTWDLIEGDKALCSSERECEVGFCRSLIQKSLESEQAGVQVLSYEDLWQHTSITELNYGITNFDNLFYAFLSIFQCITMEGWTKIMNIYEDAYVSWFVNLYFVSCVVICSFFLLNLTIAVMLMKYQELDQENFANSSILQELREFARENYIPNAICEFLIQEQSIQINKDNPEIKKYFESNDTSFMQQLLMPKTLKFDKDDCYYSHWVIRVFLDISLNPYFDLLITLAIILNTIVLAMDSYPQIGGESVQRIMEMSNQIFTYIFILEVIIKIIGLGFREFLREKFNQFDLVVVLVSVF